MSMNAAPEIAFSSEQGKANYAAARRQYPAQAIVDLKTMRDNMAHLVSVVGVDAARYSLARSLTAEISQNLREEFFLCPKVMIIAGFHEPDPVLQQHIKLLASLPNVIILTESVTNLSIPLVISTIDRVISTIQPEEAETYAPELLITFGVFTFLFPYVEIEV